MPIIILLALQTLFDMRVSAALVVRARGVVLLLRRRQPGAYMMEDRHTTPDELFAAGATFTLLAWAFTHLFVLLQALHPERSPPRLTPADRAPGLN